MSTDGKLTAAFQIDQLSTAEQTDSLESGPSTQAVHAGRRENPYHAIADPVVQTATFTFEHRRSPRLHGSQALAPGG